MRTLLVTLTTCLFVLPAHAKYSGGTGEPNNPYQIGTAADLIALGETPEDYDKHFLLTADIDLDPNLPGRKVFDRAVIAPDVDSVKSFFQGTRFAGALDGNGHTISNLTVTGESYLGLFGCLASGAEVKNLATVDVDIAGSGSYVGGLVGWNMGAVTCCHSIGIVSGANRLGGLVGENYFGTATACYSAATVSGKYDVGGLVGNNFGAVTACYSAGAVCGTAGNLLWVEGVGGLVGGNSFDGHVSHCYSTGAVRGVGRVGGLVGVNEDRALVAGSFWDIQTSGQAESAGGTGKTTAQMQDAETYQEAGWDFVGVSTDGAWDVWQMPEGVGYPVLATANGYTPPQLQGSGTPEDPYLISSALELGAMVYCNPSAVYRLAASIDLSGIRWGAAVIPLFGGTFDGNGHALAHLTIRGEGYVGLFGQLTATARVKDLGLADVNITGSGNAVGGLAGLDYGTIIHCYSTGTVTSSGECIGGLVGQNGGWGSAAGVVTDCHSTAEVSGARAVGGLAGRNGADVTQCYSIGAVVGTAEVGGLVGMNWRTVAQCRSTGPISGNESVGGLVGYNWFGEVTDCYSTGAVSGSDNVGGLVGTNDLDIGIMGGVIPGIILRCYSSGIVTANASVGGLVGRNVCVPPAPLFFAGGCSEVNDAFWDMQTSGRTESDGGTGKTTAEMQTGSTFIEAGWDFVGETANGTEDIWWINEGQDYPRLWWELDN